MMSPTRPGIHPKLKFFSIQPEEQRIIRKLSRLSFITFMKATSFKNSDYAFVFSQLVDDIANQFHLEREILVLFSPYNSFEGRTLDIVDKTIYEYQNRLDKLCFILISKDKDIKSQIQNLTIQEPESRLVIPFTYDELYRAENNTFEHLFVERLKESFHERDLFALESPLHTDTYFFGRSQSVQEFYNKYKSGENAGLFGLRKIGKTSLLYALQRQLDYRDEMSVYIDCQEPAFHQRRWYEALAYIISVIRERYKLTSTDFHEEVTYDNKTGSTYFEDDLKKIFEFRRKRILIIFDEIEHITFDISPSDHWKNENDFLFFWQAVRAVFQKNRSLFAFIIAGVNPKAVETALVRQVDNPIYRIISFTYLSPFEIEQVKEMVSFIGDYMGITFQEEVFTYLTEDFGGHPFLIRQVCSFLHKSLSTRRPVVFSKYQYKEQKEEFDRSLRDYIELVLNVLRTWYPNEYTLLERLAVGDSKNFESSVATSHALVQHLSGYGLITKEESKYHFRIEAVRQYLVEQSNVSVAVSKADKWQEVSTRRNGIETNLRNIVKQTLKANFGTNEAREKFLAVIPETRRKKLESHNLNEIFANEIYLNDLKTVIAKNWSCFENIFSKDKSRFETYLQLVNQHRIDAHAKDIEEDEYGLLLIALTWIEKQINQHID